MRQVEQAADSTHLTTHMSRAPESPSMWSVLRPSELRRHVARWLGVLVGVPSDLRWTTRRPDVAGYYWVRAPKLTARVSHFYHAHGSSWLTNDYIHLDFAYGKPVEYAGPLPKPPSAKTTRHPNQQL